MQTPFDLDIGLVSQAQRGWYKLPDEPAGSAYLIGRRIAEMIVLVLVWHLIRCSGFHACNVGKSRTECDTGGPDRPANIRSSQYPTVRRGRIGPPTRLPDE